MAMVEVMLVHSAEVVCIEVLYVEVLHVELLYVELFYVGEEQLLECKQGVGEDESMLKLNRTKQLYLQKSMEELG